MSLARVDDATASSSRVRLDDALPKASGSESKVGADGDNDKAASAIAGPSFSQLGLSEPTARGIASQKFTSMTEVQARCIPPLMAGRDVLGGAATGSGKTLAFLIPIIERLYRLSFKPRNGTGAIVISPTRELALQIYKDAEKVLAGGHSQTLALLAGGNDHKKEALKLGKGVNLVIATPGRLMDHLQSTRGFVYSNLKVLCIDEADRILDEGFKEQMDKILSILPKDRQSMLFSATQTDNVRMLASVSLRNAIRIDVQSKSAASTVAGLTQSYVICDSDLRFLLLYRYLDRFKGKKIIVFMSSKNSVDYHAHLLNTLNIPVLHLIGDMKQEKRTRTFEQFKNMQTGALLCTDVAARGLHIPGIDTVIQYDPPDDAETYIHRVGRTARAGQKGDALMLLLPAEVGFLHYLAKAKVPRLDEKVLKGLPKVQGALEQLIEKSYHLRKAAEQAFKGYLSAYNSRALKKVFDVHKLDLHKVAKGFGFKEQPRVNINFGMSSKGGKRKKGQDDDDDDDVPMRSNDREPPKSHKARSFGKKPRAAK